MKKILVSALSIGLLTACSPADDEPTNLNHQLTGKWQNIKVEFYENDVLTESEVVTEENESCPDYTEFKLPGEFQLIDKDGNCEQSIEQTGAYTFNGHSLMLSSNNEIHSYKVITVTDTELVVEETYTESGVTNRNKAFFKKLN